MSVGMFVIIKAESERVKGKTFRKLHGVPLYKKLLREIDKLGWDVVVNTDSRDVIKGIAEDEWIKNAVCAARDQEHIDMEQDDDVSPVLAMTHAFCKHMNYDVVVTTHITSPFLTAHTIAHAVRLMLDGGFDSVSSITKHNEFAMFRDKPVNYDLSVVQRTQDLEPVVFQNGAFYIFKREAFLDSGHRVTDNHLFVEVGFPDNIEIDTEEDWLLAKAVAGGGY